MTTTIKHAIDDAAETCIHQMMDVRINIDANVKRVWKYVYEKWDDEAYVSANRVTFIPLPQAIDPKHEAFKSVIITCN